MHPTNQGEQWILRIYSASKEFIVWLQEAIEDIFGAKVKTYREEKVGKSDAFILKYGKMSAINILKVCYYKNAVALDRKAQLAKECCSSQKGWAKSKTINLN